MTERDIKPNLNRLVVYKPLGTKYRLTAGIIRRNPANGECWYQAELQDLSALRGVLICRLEDVEVVGTG